MRAVSLLLMSLTLGFAPLEDKKIDIELREADVRNVYRLLGEVGGVNVMLDECVQGKVDIKLKNVPVSLVFDALAAKMHFTYEDGPGKVVFVHCGAAPAVDAPRVSLSEKGAPLPDVVAHLATAAKLDGVDYRATKKPNVDITLVDVRLGTALTALGDESGLRVTTSGKRVVVSD